MEGIFVYDLLGVCEERSGGDRISLSHGAGEGIYFGSYIGEGGKGESGILYQTSFT